MKKGVIYVVITALLFGSMEVSLKLAGASFDAVQLTFLRFFIGGLFLLPFALVDLKKRDCKLTLTDWGYLLSLGVICICFSMTLFQIGVMRTNASLAAVIISMNPAFTMVFAHFLAIEKFTKRKALTLLLSFIGLVIAANPFGGSGAGGADGILLTVIAAVAFGFYTALGKKRIAKIGGIAQNSLSFLLGSGALLIGLLATGSPVWQGISTDNIGLLLYIGIFVTGIGYYCYLKAIEISGPSLASIAFFIKPVFAPLLALAVLGEELTLRIVIGVLFVLAGSFVSLTAGKKLPFQKK